MEAVRAGADGRTRLELALVKAARPEVDASMSALLARIERLEGGDVSAVAAERDVAPGERSGPVAVAEAPAAPAALEQRAPASDPPSAAARPEARAEPAAAQAPVEVSVASIASVPERAERSAAVAGEQAGESQSPSQSQSAASVAEGLAPLLAWWPAVVDLVRTDNALLGACIEEARPVEVTGEDLTVAFSATAPFLKKKAENPDNRAAVTAALQDVTGRRWRLSYELQDGLAEQDGAPPWSGSEEEWLKRFMEEFDAEELPGEWAPAGGEASPEDDASSDIGPSAHGGENGAQALTSEEKGA